MDRECVLKENCNYKLINNFFRNRTICIKYFENECTYNTIAHLIDRATISSTNSPLVIGSRYKKDSYYTLLKPVKTGSLKYYSFVINARYNIYKHGVLVDE